MTEAEIALELKKLQLQAKLAEFQVLKNELQYRADFQQRILQLQATALTTIIAATFINAIPGELRYWLVYLIPIVSLLLGFQYYNHSARIFLIANYLYLVEKEINEISERAGLLRWEIELRARERIVGVSRSRGHLILAVDRAVFWVLNVPALIATIIAISWLFLYIELFQDLLMGITGAPEGMFAPFTNFNAWIQVGLLTVIALLAFFYILFISKLADAQSGELTEQLDADVTKAEAALRNPSAPTA